MDPHPVEPDDVESVSGLHPTVLISPAPVIIYLLPVKVCTLGRKPDLTLTLQTASPSCFAVVKGVESSDWTLPSFFVAAGFRKKARFSGEVALGRIGGAWRGVDRFCLEQSNSWSGEGSAQPQCSE